MAKRNWTAMVGGSALWLLSACSQMATTGSEGLPAAGDTAALAPPVLASVMEANRDVPPETPKALKKNAADESVTVIASTEWSDHGPYAADMTMPQMEPVTEVDLRETQPIEANVGVVDFLRRHLLVGLSALCLLALGVYAFYVYPSRRETGNNRYG